MLQLTGDHTMDFMNLNPDPGNKMNAGSCGSGSTLTAFKYRYIRVFVGESNYTVSIFRT